MEVTSRGPPIGRLGRSPNGQIGSPNGQWVAAQEVLSQEASKTLLVTTGPAPPDADSGRREPHRNEPNARRALGTLVADRTLPLTEDSLMLVAYKAGGGDPWTGYLTIKAATEQSFTGARDPLAVLRKRGWHDQHLATPTTRQGAALVEVHETRPARRDRTHGPDRPRPCRRAVPRVRA